MVRKIQEQPSESVLIKTILEMSGITTEKIEKQIESLINDVMRPKLLYWDIKKMSELTCMEPSYLEKYVLHDPRMKVYERRNGKGKRFWEYEGSVKALKEIVDEWY
ncbi:hypothetical protein [Ureibacillus thermophilus]|uniref:Uncharacterized protein n=1 Tax=Ureibacillus thermophilus TaxID=367743 RepID=A0A4P6UWJ6_9BACL|nr:hypothetical protein [Ureibacillus thermophilus]QBK26711.1 hypothetical protein DKZ56_13155 [Ureibacillus thermophilus]